MATTEVDVPRLVGQGLTLGQAVGVANTQGRPYHTVRAALCRAFGLDGAWLDEVLDGSR
jgi:hypothetical protein